MENLSEMEDNEADRLDTAWELTTSSRLGCQAVIKGDVVAEFPMYTRNYVQEGGGIQLGKSDPKPEADSREPGVGSREPEKVLRRAELDGTTSELLQPGEPERITAAIAELKAAMSGSDRAVIQDKTHALNHATQHLAEATMNRTVREALAGRNVKDV